MLVRWSYACKVNLGIVSTLTLAVGHEFYGVSLSGAVMFAGAKSRVIVVGDTMQEAC
jgi:hypothetical protein